MHHRLQRRLEESVDLTPRVGVRAAHETLANERDIELGHSAFPDKRQMLCGVIFRFEIFCKGPANFFSWPRFIAAFFSRSPESTGSSSVASTATTMLRECVAFAERPTNSRNSLLQKPRKTRQSGDDAPFARESKRSGTPMRKRIPCTGSRFYQEIRRQKEFVPCSCR